MGDRLVAILNECEDRLEEHRVLLKDALEKGGQQDEPQATMLMRIMEFGLQTIKAVHLLVTTDVSNALLACTLTRAFFEAAVRILWASRSLPGAQNLWARLQAYWIREDLKWANAARSSSELSNHAETIRKDRQKALRDVAIEPAQGIYDMLRGIEKANRD